MFWATIVSSKIISRFKVDLVVDRCKEFMSIDVKDFFEINRSIYKR